MRITFNPSTVAALIAPPNNKDITFDLRGQNIFARGVKFCGTDTWRDIKINNVSIDSNTLDLRDGDNTTLTNINGVVTINSTWRPVVDNLTSDSTTSSLSANQGRVLVGLINSKSDSEHNHDDRYLRLTGGIMQLGEGLKFHADNSYFGTDQDARIISLLDSNNKICNGGLIIDERGTLDGKEYVTELLRIRDSEFKWKGNNILHSGNSYIKENTITINGSSTTWENTWRTILVNDISIGKAPLNFKAGNGISLSESNGTITVTSTSSTPNILLHQYLSSTDTTQYPLIWGGDDHNNTSDSTGAVYKSYDKLSWQTSSQTLYTPNIQTNNIKNLSVGGGIYWNPYVESTTDGNDVASITVVRQGIAGGTTLVLSQMNNANDTIQFQTNGSARLYHNSYPILTTQNTYVSNNKGYINGTEITQVNNADSATKVIVNQHTTNDVNYPLVWSNQANTSTVTENQLFKSWSDLYYNPKNRRLYTNRYVGSYANLTQTSMRHIDADLNSKNTDHTLYIGYGQQTYTVGTNIYASTGSGDTTNTRSLLAQFNASAGINLDSNINIRPSVIFRNNDTFKTTVSYYTAGQEALCFETKQAGTSIIFYNGTIHAASESHWYDLINGVQIKNNCLAIGAGWAHGVNPNYRLRVGGDIGTGGNIYINHSTNNNMNYDTSNPRIVFSENGSQAVGLVYTDYDSYRSSKGLKVMDVNNDDASNVWFEVQGYNYSSGYVKNGSNDNYVLLGGGGHKAISDFVSFYGDISEADNYSPTGLKIIGVTGGSNTMGNGCGSILQMCNNAARGYKPNVDNGSANWYTQIMGNTDDKIRYRTSTNGSGWTSWKTLLSTADLQNINVASATNTYHLYINYANTWSTWYWAGQGGQPSWLWGSNDGTNMYVWNPSNFSVKYATSAGSVAWANVTGKPTIPNPTNYYWANIKVSASSNTKTQPSVNTIYANNWFRSQGDSGWYNESYGGGIWMNDSSWIRTFGGKGFYCDNQIYSSNSIRMSNICLQNSNEINNDANGTLHLNYRNTGNITLCNGGGAVTIGTTSTDIGSNKLFVNGSEFIDGVSNVRNHVFADGFRHRSHNSNDSVLLAGGGYSQGVPVRYWAIYYMYIGNSSTDVAYTKRSGNYNFITSKAWESVGVATFDISFPSGYNKNNTLIFGNGDHRTSSSWKTPVYATITTSTELGTASKIRVMISNDSSLDTGFANIYFMCMG